MKLSNFASNFNLRHYAEEWMVDEEAESETSDEYDERATFWMMSQMMSALP